MAIRKTARKRRKTKQIIGWREWVRLPALGIDRVKAKIDTGARSSTLHAFDLKFSEQSGVPYVSFKVHPQQRNTRETVTCRAEVLEYRNVRSSNGKVESRPVILTTLELLEERWPIELTLTNRDEMGFRMLLGRQSFRQRFLVDAGRSFYGKKRKGPSS